MSVTATIAAELSVPERQVHSAVALIDGGATVPFIARYRKEATGGLDDIQLRHLAARLITLRNLSAEKKRVLAVIAEQGKLTDALAEKINAAETRARLDDLYLPYKSKRKTKAQKAREAGLEPLLDALLSDPRQDPESVAAGYVCAEIVDTKAALDGAKQILMERAALDADLLEMVRDRLRRQGRMTAAVLEGQEAAGAKFRDYFDFSEPFETMPGHRVLAVLRGQQAGALSVELRDTDHDAEAPYLERLVASRLGVSDKKRTADRWLLRAAKMAWRVKVKLRCELALMSEIRQRAEEEAIGVFASNLRDLLLAAPAGPRITLGLDPGIRTGVKVAVVDATGKLVDTATIYPFQPRNDVEGSLRTLTKLVEKHRIELIAIGNGTASRETDRLSATLIKRCAGRTLTKIVVSEAGASVYSASELASEELPDVDVSLRGAASIARRLQDPLAELVKIDPRSIGVGQYQHDVSTHELSKSLGGVVEDCVNAVGVDLNTASSALLTHVSGLSASQARSIVSWRDDNGAFSSRRQLLKVPRLGAKTFEQCAGFLRIRDGVDPLDASSVHPEAYPVVERIAARTRRPVKSLIGDAALLSRLRPEQFTDERFGLPTVTDILSELNKPGRDPRPSFQTATFADGVETLTDLKEGMTLEGVVTNVTAFGAFVDVGVHQDGLVHVSQLADRFVRDPREVVKTGQVVKVRVMTVDVARKRIGLSMRSDAGRGRGDRGHTERSRSDRRPQQERPDRRPRRSERPKAEPAKSEGFGSLGDLLRGR
ncbi:MAG: Tex family protein [Myxococcota bacterium]|nr:Tex family protein [Myxococcota bacterium]